MRPGHIAALIVIILGMCMLVPLLLLSRLDESSTGEVDEPDEHDICNLVEVTGYVLRGEELTISFTVGVYETHIVIPIDGIVKKGEKE